MVSIHHLGKVVGSLISCTSVNMNPLQITQGHSAYAELTIVAILLLVMHLQFSVVAASSLCMIHNAYFLQVAARMWEGVEIMLASFPALPLAIWLHT